MGTYFEFYIKNYIKETLFHFSENYCVLVTKRYCALTKEEIINLAIFVRFILLYLRNIRGTFSKYFQNNISETDISSAVQR